MDLTFSDQETAFRDELGGGCRNKPGPAPSEGDDDTHYAYRREWQRKLYDAGWAAPAWPAEYGGRGASLTESAVYFEASAARACQWPRTCSASCSVARR